MRYTQYKMCEVMERRMQLIGRTKLVLTAGFKIKVLYYHQNSPTHIRLLPDKYTIKHVKINV